MKCHINDSIWGVEEIHDLNLPKYDMAVRFTEKRVDGYYVFLAKSTNIEIWQREAREFAILCGEEFYHIELLDDKGLKIVYRHRATRARAMFERNFFYLEERYEHKIRSFIYSMVDRKDLQDIVEEMIDPRVNVVIEPTSGTQPMLIRIEAPYLSARFLLEMPTPEDHLILNLWRGDETHVRDFKAFVKEAKIRCKEAAIGEYYENCGGYMVNGKPAKGLFTPTKYRDETRYEFHPDEIFYDLAVPRLLLENDLIQVLPEGRCPFLGESIENFRYSIKPSHDMILITERDETKEQSYALKIPSECLGLYQTSDKSFLAILRGNDDEHARLVSFIKSEMSQDGYIWGDLGGPRSKSLITLDNCMVTDDIIAYEDQENHGDLNLWSISANRSCNPVDGFCDLRCISSDIYVNQMSTQVLAVPAGTNQEPRIFIAVRVYRPRDYCDVFALFDPKSKYRIYGKAYNVLADEMTAKPRTLRDLVKIFKENEDLKKKIPKFEAPL